MKCQFRGCDDVTDGERKFYKYCKKHSCSGCSRYDINHTIYYVKKAHYVNKSTYADAYIPHCNECGIIHKDYIVNVNYYNSSNICKFDDCEKTIRRKNAYCIHHRKHECVSCHDTNTNADFGRCNRCLKVGKHNCHSCDRFYIGQFMASNTQCKYCRYYTERKETDYGPLQVIGDCIKNIYNYKSEMLYPIKLFKSYNRPVKDKFLNSLVRLPQEIILIILTYANLQPSYVTVQKLVSLHKVKELILF